MPIWKCNKCNDFVVIGSLKELKKLTKDIPEDLHKPWIDKVTIKCKCGDTKRRIPDILDVWIDAGSASWNCLYYPGREDYFKKLFPADFITEAHDQIRGWFNLLFVASMIAMKKPSFKAVYMHGHINDALGRKMSKSLGNYILPEEVISKYGADTLRHYMIGGAAPGIDLHYNFDDMKVKYKNLSILWNLHNYVIDLASGLTNPEKLKITEKELLLEEKYIFSKLNSTIKKITEAFNDYKINEAPLIAEELFLELSRSYIQLTREKSAGNEKERKVLLYTVYNVLVHLLKIFAPVAPFITEKIYLELKNRFNLKEESIHLFDWPEYDEKKIDEKLEKQMHLVNTIIQVALSLREKSKLSLRWPVKEVVIATKDKNTINAVEILRGIIKKQTNAKDITVLENLPGVKTKVRFDFGKLAPDFKELTPKIIAKVATDSPESILAHIEKEGKYSFKINGKQVDIVKEYLIIERDVPKQYEESSFRHGFIYLNKQRTDELEAEGFAREIMRRAQSLRKEAGLKKKDKIMLMVKVDDELKEMLDEWEDAIKEKTGAKKIRINSIKPARKYKHSSKENVKGNVFELFLDRV